MHERWTNEKNDSVQGISLKSGKWWAMVRALVSKQTNDTNQIYL